MYQPLHTKPLLRKYITPNLMRVALFPLRKLPLYRDLSHSDRHWIANGQHTPKSFCPISFALAAEVCTACKGLGMS
jgi:hypothetical protein